MNPVSRSVVTLYLGLSFGFAQGAELPEPFVSDGWYSWRFDAVEHDQEWCCYQWNSGHPTKKGCSLDGHGQGHSIIDPAPQQNDSEELQLYALVKDGQLDRLRVLSPSCPVSSDLPWNDLGRVSVHQSLGWIDALQPPTKVRRSDPTMAIAGHAGNEASRRLKEIARQGASVKQRKEAIFWMGQLRISESRAELLDLMTNDASQRIREHAIFSYAQSPAEDRYNVLIDVVENQQLAMHDRKKALFWLAQSEDEAGVDYIQTLILGHQTQ